MRIRFKSKVAKIFREVAFAIRHSPEPSRNCYALFAIFCITNYLIPLLVFSPSETNPYNWAFNFRIVGQLLCVGLLLFSSIPRELKIVRAVYWYVTILFCLPMLSTISCLLHPNSFFWFGSFCLSILLLAILQTSFVFFFTLLLGFLLGLLIFSIVDSFAPQSLPQVLSLIYVVLFSCGIGIVFARRRELETRDKIESLRKLTRTIAHEMRTPLSTISITSQTYERYIGRLVQFYRKNLNALPPGETPIEPYILDYLETSPKILYNNSRRNLLLIEMMIKKYRGVDEIEHLQRCSIKECINLAISEYSFAPNQSEVIAIEEFDDFVILADETLFMHIIFNLISNSLRHLANPTKGAIKVWSSSSATSNKLHFQDCGCGIAPHILDNVFLTKSGDGGIFGTGIGLSFCLQAMRRFGGSIECKSDSQTYTEVILIFPRFTDSSLA